jgi:hypothetical protein
LFARAYAPSTLGSFLRAFTFGHIRQLDAVASRFLLALARLTGLIAAASNDAHTGPGYALLDVDDTLIELHGHRKQGAGIGYTRIRGINALLATLTTTAAAPAIIVQRLRKGECNSAQGIKRLVGDAVKLSRRLLGAHTCAGADGLGLLRPRLGGRRADRWGCGVVTVRMDAQVKKAIAAIADYA